MTVFIYDKVTVLICRNRSIMQKIIVCERNILTDDFKSFFFGISEDLGLGAVHFNDRLLFNAVDGLYAVRSQHFLYNTAEPCIVALSR